MIFTDGRLNCRSIRKATCTEVMWRKIFKYLHAEGEIFQLQTAFYWRLILCHFLGISKVVCILKTKQYQQPFLYFIRFNYSVLKCIPLKEKKFKKKTKKQKCNLQKIFSSENACVLEFSWWIKIKESKCCFVQGFFTYFTESSFSPAKIRNFQIFFSS